MISLVHIIENTVSFMFSKNIIYLGIGIIGVGFVIAFHEMGHFLFCKLFNIRTPTFSIGMGPRLFTKRIGDTDFTLSAIPLGGYVEIAQSPEDSNEQLYAQDEYFAHKPYWQKMLVMSGGILFNLIFAVLMFAYLFWSGMPNTPLAYPDNADLIISTVAQDSPAQAAGLASHDKISALNGTLLNNSVSELLTYIQGHPSETVKLTIEREGQSKDIEVKLGENRISDSLTIGFLGVDFETHPLSPMPFIASIKKGFALTKIIISQTAKIFKWMFQERHIKGLSGPIMIFSQTIQHAERGAKIFLAFLAIISINLAVLNLIPLPILDGGQALFATIEAIIRRSLPSRIKEYIMIVTWIGLLALTLYLSFKDIQLIKMFRSQSEIPAKESSK